jgi:hypothetical protein
MKRLYDGKTLWSKDIDAVKVKKILDILGE